MESKNNNENLILNKVCQTKAEISETETYPSNLVKVKDPPFKAIPKTIKVNDFIGSVIDKRDSNNTEGLDMCQPLEETKIFIKPKIEVLEIKGQDNHTNIKAYIEDIKDEQNENCYSSHGESKQHEFDIKIEPNEENDQFTPVPNIQHTNYNSFPIKKDEMDIEIKYEDFKYIENQNDNSILSDPNQPTEDGFFNEDSGVGVQPFCAFEDCIKTEVTDTKDKNKFSEKGSLQYTHKIESFQCGICSKNFAYKGQLLIHTESQSCSKKLECNICLKPFSRKYCLRRHMILHNEEKPYQCEICSHRFTESRKLERHMRLHTGENLHKCEICFKGFSENYKLKRHMRTHTGENVFQKCEICFKTFSQYTNLQNHMLLHTDDRPFECEICFKKFRRKDSAVIHMRSHSRVKPYKCKICSKAFSENKYLQQHMRLHTGKRLYKCGICLKQFTQNGSLQKHIRLHTGEKPFECKVCLKKFARKDGYNIHMRHHNGEKPHKCDICLKQFAEKKALKSHIRSH